MKKMNLWLLASLMVGALTLVACHDDDNSAPGNNTPATSVDPATMKMAGLSGFVVDKDGNALSGVKVTTGSTSTTTDKNGGFSFASVGTKASGSSTRTVVKFEKSGYFSITRAAEFAETDIWDVVLIPKGPAQFIDPSYEDQSIKATENEVMKVDFQQDGIKNENNILTYGNVRADIAYISPDDEDFNATMPGGDLAAVRTDVNGAENDGQEVQLVSYGMTRVDLTDSYGNPLNLAKDATMHFPVPAQFDGKERPTTIPLWSFDESKGLWIEEGIATYDESTDTYVGTVPHFSWVNLDHPEVRTKLKVIVKDEAGNLLPCIKVDIDRQKSVYTNNKGEATTYVPRNTEMIVTVHSKDYANYTNEVIKNVGPLSGDDRTVTTVEIVLPTVAHISGTVTNQGAGNNVATIWIDYNGKISKKTHSDLEGKFYLMAPADYQGPAKLKVQSADGKVKSIDITLDGQDHAYNIDFTSDVNAGGTAIIKVNDQTYTIIYGKVEAEYGGGVTIVDKYLQAENGEKYIEEEDDGTWKRFSLTLSNYTPGQTTYTEGFKVDVALEGSADQIMTMVTEGKVTITPISGGNYRIQVDGTGYMHGWQWENEETREPAKAQVTVDITMPLYAKGEKKQNIKADQILPSFAPTPSGLTAACGVAVESSVLGKGGFVAYQNTSLTSDDYFALINQAKQAFGEPNDKFEAIDQYNNMCRHVFRSGDKYLYYYWNGKWTSDGSYVKFEDANFDKWSLTTGWSGGMGYITIVAYDGFKLEDNYRVKADRNW